MEGPAYVPQQLGQTGRSKLHEAAYKGDLQEVVHLLQGNVHPDTPSRLHSDNGRQALHLAVLGAHLDVVNELLNRGADPDAADLHGFRPVHIAAQKGAVSIVKRLHAAKANLKTQTKAGWQAVHLAASYGHVSVLKQLQEYHCNLAATDYSFVTPLHIAAGRGHHHAVRWLIKAGVSLGVRDDQGMSAADHARLANHHAIYMDLTEAAKISASKYRTGRRQRFHPDVLSIQPKGIEERYQSHQSHHLRKFPSSPNLHRSSSHIIPGQYFLMSRSTSTVLPDIQEPPPNTTGLKSKAHNLPSNGVLLPLESPPPLHLPQHSSPNQEEYRKTPTTQPKIPESTQTQCLTPESPPTQQLPPQTPPIKSKPPQSPAPQQLLPQTPPIKSKPPQSPAPQQLPPESPPIKPKPPQSPAPQQLPPESPPVQSQPPKSPPLQHLPAKSPSQQHLLLQSPPVKEIPTESLLSQQPPSDSQQKKSLPPKSPPQENLPPEKHLTQQLPTESHSDSKKSAEESPPPTGTEDKPPASPVHTCKSLPPSVQSDLTSTVTSNNSTVSSPPSDILGSSVVPSPSPNVTDRRPSVTSEQGKPKKKDKKGVNRGFRKFFRSKSDPKVRISAINWNSGHVYEEIERDGFSLGHGKQNHHGEPPAQKEAAFLDLSVQEAARPFPEGPDVYPCTTNPRGIVIILNNKSFQGSPDRTRYGAECDTKNLEDVFDKMGYDVRTRVDLTRQDTLDLFLEVSRFPMLQSVSCLFVFILSHGEGAKSFSTYDNKAVSLDEVQSFFLNRACPSLRGKPKVFFSHFCRGNDEETRSQYSCDAQREAYKDMMCLYSSTEGFQALRNHRLGTPSVRALCLTLARYAHIKHFRDIVTKFQDQYEQMEGSTSPEVQDFKFKKYFYLNPTGKSRLCW